MQNTLNKMYEKSKKVLEAYPSLQKQYADRDREGEMLVRDFFAKTGLGPDEEFTDFDDLDVGELEDAKQQAKETTGWSHYLDEEMEYIWFDGKLKGKMMMSCRGNAYGASLTIFGKGGGKWRADNETAGVWVK